MSAANYYLTFNFNKHLEGIVLSRPTKLPEEVLGALTKAIERFSPEVAPGMHASEDEEHLVMRDIGTTPFGILNALGAIGWKLFSLPTEENNYYYMVYGRK